jgi:hypothetical protein
MRIERIGALGLDDADLRHAVDEADVLHLHKALAQRGGVGEVAAGDDQVLGHLALHLFDDLHRGRLLAFEAIGVDGVEQIDGKAADQFQQQAQAAVEVSLQLYGERAVVHRLRKLAPRDLALGNKDDGTQSGACGVCRHGCRGVSG